MAVTLASFLHTHTALAQLTVVSFLLKTDPAISGTAVAVSTHSH